MHLARAASPLNPYIPPNGGVWSHDDLPKIYLQNLWRNKQKAKEIEIFFKIFKYKQMHIKGYHETSISTIDRKSNEDWNFEWKRIFGKTKIGTNKLQLKLKVKNFALN